MTTWKPYIFEGREYLEARSIQSWEDIVNQYPGVEIPRSELNKPYRWENYQADEWSWPGFDVPCIWCYEFPFPEWDPPGGGNPCEADDKCKYLGIVGPTEVACDETYQYKTVLVFEGCDLPPGIIVGWSASCGEILSVSAVGAKWRSPECCEGEKCVICATGPGCESCIEVTLADCVTCIECDEFTLSGPGQIAAGANWVGTISPACPYLNCADHVTVVSNSGCTGLGCSINAAGSQLTISGTTGKCGQITVTINYNTETEDCEDRTASDVFRITGAGDWVIKEAPVLPRGCQAGGGCGCGCGITNHGNCITEPLRYGTDCRPFTFADCCYRGWSQQCKGANPPGCTDSNSGPPCGSTVSCATAGCTCTGSPCNVGGGCCCSNHAYWSCEWQCTCT